MLFIRQLVLFRQVSLGLPTFAICQSEIGYLGSLERLVLWRKQHLRTMLAKHGALLTGILGAAPAQLF